MSCFHSVQPTLVYSHSSLPHESHRPRHGHADGPVPLDRRLSMLVETMANPAFVTDPSGTILASNSASRIAATRHDSVLLQAHGVLQPANSLVAARWTAMLLAAATEGASRIELDAGNVPMQVTAVALGEDRLVIAVSPPLPVLIGEDPIARCVRESALTHSEEQVLRLLLEGASVRDIAESRGTRLPTVRAQVRALLVKTNTHSIRELVARTLRG